MIHEHITEQKNESMKFVGKRMKLEKKTNKQKSNKQNPQMNPHKHRKTDKACSLSYVALGHVLNICGIPASRNGILEANILGNVT